MKGIILAGGSGTRLYPLTIAVSKQLLPVYDKPMIYHPLSALLSAGIREILVITTPHDAEAFRRLLGDGSNFGIDLSYAIQESPDGLPQAFQIGARHIGDDNVTLILGDNLFSGNDIGGRIASQANEPGATIFGYWMQNPSAYGVVEVGGDDCVLTIEEKPSDPRSNYAVPGIYVFDHRVVEYSRDLRPSARGELEMIDLERKYLADAELKVQLLPRGSTWLDMGSPATLADASEFIRALQNRQGLLIDSPEEIAWQRGWITDEKLLARADELGRSTYGESLRQVIRRAEVMSN